MAQPNITPPIRQPLLMQNGAPLSIGNADIQTTRDWWMYWNQLGDQANANSKLTSEGAHTSRPVTDNMPDGAIYIESDRGAIYQNQGGNWQYVAGVMYGTLSPDQRPTDLGVYDGGFEFRATDSSPTDTGRDFVWSGTAWTEITQVLYNTHALRPAPADAPARCIYVEDDRGAIYQNQLGVWEYLAGTMWGTLVPDQRPTDLGAHDVGFTFRTSVAPPQEFLWSGGMWVEVTPVTGAVNLTHPNVVTKVGATTGQIVEGGITDLSAANSGALYISAAGQVAIGSTTPSDQFMVRPAVGSGKAGITVEHQGGGADESTLTVLHHNPAYGWRTRAFDGDGSFILDVQSGGVWRTNAIYVASNNGSVGLGTPPGFQLHLSTDSAGKPSTNTWQIASGAAVKKNVKNLEGGLGVINKLRPVESTYNGFGGTPAGERVVSLIAEEVAQVLPGTVKRRRGKLKETDAEETDLLSFNVHEVIFHMILAIQELSAEIERLKA